MFSIKSLHMVFGSPFYEVLKIGTTLKAHNNEGGANGSFFMD